MFLDRSWWATGFRRRGRGGGGGGGPPPFHLVTRCGFHCWFSSGVFWVFGLLSLLAPQAPAAGCAFGLLLVLSRFVLISRRRYCSVIKLIVFGSLVFWGCGSDGVVDGSHPHVKGSAC